MRRRKWPDSNWRSLTIKPLRIEPTWTPLADLPSDSYIGALVAKHPDVEAALQADEEEISRQIKAALFTSVDPMSFARPTSRSWIVERWRDWKINHAARS